jgi:hypothetical protein
MTNKMLSFVEFEQMYESYGFVFEADAAVPPVTTPADQSITAGGDAMSGSDLFSIFKDLEASDDATTKVSEAIAKGKKGSVVSVNPFKLIKPGEESDRVKLLQKSIGTEQTGVYDKETVKAVKAFQKENKLRVDGIVGPQTYTKILEIKDKLAEDEIAKRMEEFKKLSINLINDPRFYLIFESITTVNVNGVIYVICIPKADAKDKIEALKKEGAITSGFEWLEKAVDAIGKAIVYTAVGGVLVTLALAKAIISGAISVVKYVVEGALYCAASLVHGLGQVASWVNKGLKSGAEALYNNLKSSGEEVWKGFVTVIGAVIKGAQKAGEAIASFFSGVGSYLQSVAKSGVKVIEAIGKLAVEILRPVAKVIGVTISAGATILKAAGDAVAWVAKKTAQAATAVVKAIGSGISSGAQAIWTGTKAAAGAVWQGVKGVTSGVKTVVGAAIKAGGDLITGIGNAMSDFGSWLLKESFSGTGEYILESLTFRPIVLDYSGLDFE